LEEVAYRFDSGMLIVQIRFKVELH
jgi:hypothetical protein